MKANDTLSLLEMAEIAIYTVQKINNYPKSFGKTVENYFHLLFPDEIKAYLIRREVNSNTLDVIGVKEQTEPPIHPMQAQMKRVQDVRNLRKLFVEQQEGVLTLISDMLDELEADLSVLDVNEGDVPDGE